MSGDLRKAISNMFPDIDLTHVALEEKRQALNDMQRVLSSPAPGKSIPAESLEELRILNDQLSSIDDRLDSIESSARAESDKQRRRFIWSTVVGVASASAAITAAVVSVILLSHS